MDNLHILSEQVIVSKICLEIHGPRKTVTIMLHLKASIFFLFGNGTGVAWCDRDCHFSWFPVTANADQHLNSPCPLPYYYFIRARLFKSRLKLIQD